MSSLLGETEKAVREQRVFYRKVKHFFRDNQRDLMQMSKALEHIEILRVNFDSDSVDISVAGDQEVLKSIFRALRPLGYEPRSRPTIHPQSTYQTYFDHPDKDLTIWLNFSSTLCKRVKVGTKMQEVDIYETVCE